MRGIVPNHWNFAIVDDDPNILDDVRAFLEAETFADLKVQVTSLDFADALNELRARKIDLVILDLFRGERVEGNRAGEEILAGWKKAGFAPVIVYTAVPEDYEGPRNKFVRLLGKNEGLERLKEEIHSIIQTTVPRIYKALVDLLDKSLTEHMWKFVAENWDGIAELAHLSQLASRNAEFSRFTLLEGA